MNSSLKIHREMCCEGYTFYCALTPDALPDQRATLVNMKGEIVHEWSLVGGVRMLSGGSLLGNKHNYDPMGVFQEGWDGREEWSITNIWQHHDFQREGNPIGYYAPGQTFVDQGKTLILFN